MQNSVFKPEETLFRNGLYRKLPSEVIFIPCNEGSIVERFSETDNEQVKYCGLLDATAITRCGFRGENAAKHLSSLAYPIPQAVNQALSIESGETVLRLSQSEFWLLGSVADQGAKLSQDFKIALPEKRCYPLFCQNSHAHLILSGTYLADIMAKLCAVDMRGEAFPLGSIAQTSVARINAIVVSHHISTLPVFSLLFDSTYLAYLWDVLLDAINEFDGKPVGSLAFSE